MKKLILVPVMIVLVVGLIFGGCAEPAPAPAPTPAPAPAPAPAPTPAPPAKEPTVLKLISFKPDVPPANVFEHTLIDYVKDESNGELIIEWVGGPEAIPMFDTPAAVSRGATDIVSTIGSAMDAMIPGWETMAHTTLEIPELRASEAWAIFGELAKKKNMYLLGQSTPCSAMSMAGYFSNVRVEKVADFAGLKVAVPAPAYSAHVEAMKGTPVFMGFPDYFTAMERGTVDAYTVGVPGIIDFGLQDVTKYMIDETVGSCGSTWMINLDVWNSLPPHLQDAMNVAAVKMENDGIRQWDIIVEGVKRDAAAAGVEIYPFSPEESKKFDDVYLEAAWGMIMERDPEFVAKLKAILVP